MEILVVGDSHLSGRNPIARKDDLVEVQFNKWESVVNISNDNDVPIIHTGDIFNVAVIANSLLSRFGDIISKLNNPLYFVWGNHDLMYHSLDLWDRTSLGVLWMNNDKVRHISQFWEDYNIWWAWYDWGADDIQWFGDCPDLFLAHKAIVNNKQTGVNSWILDDKDFCLPVTELPFDFKLAICGHWHRQYQFKYKNTKVINPGPMIRRTVEEWFIPTIQLVSLDTLMVKHIKISDLDPEQVLSRTHIEQNIETITENVVKFIEQLRNVNVKHKKSYLKTLIYNLDQHELPKKVENLIRKLIADLIEKGAIDESV